VAYLPRSAGRRTFGDDPEGYDQARPDYPRELFARLAERCGLLPGARVFEIGAGSGLATRALLAAGAGGLLAIEPDPRLADYLRTTIAAPALEVRTCAFEDVDLADGAFDLGVAAMSLHWLEPVPALAKARQALKPGGWFAAFWNVYEDPREPDAFRQIVERFGWGDVPRPPSMAGDGGLPFALRTGERLEELRAAGFATRDWCEWRWTQHYTTAGMVALYGSFSPLKAAPPDMRARILTEVARVADEAFGGEVERTFLTRLYLGRRD
jgi:SAM-dependent methyltransferase